MVLLLYLCLWAPCTIFAIPTIQCSSPPHCLPAVASKKCCSTKGDLSSIFNKFIFLIFHFPVSAFIVQENSIILLTYQKKYKLSQYNFIIQKIHICQFFSFKGNLDIACVTICLSGIPE